MRSSIFRKSGIIGALAVMALGPGWAFAQAEDREAQPAEPPPAVFGTWVTEPKTEVTIGPCEQGYCGSITRIVVPPHIREQYGDQLDQIPPEAYTDQYNEDPALRSRPIQGLTILTLTEQTAPNRYDGWIYNPEDGKTYEGFVEMLGPDRLRLTGCVMFKTICQGQEWERAPEPLPDPEADDPTVTGSAPATEDTTAVD